MYVRINFPKIAIRVTYILQRIDALGRFFDFTSDDLRDELRCELGERAANSLALHDISHLLSDGANLRRPGICGFLDLVWTSLRKCDGEQTNKVIIGRLHSDVSLNERLPLAHEGSQLVGGEVQAMEVGQAVFPLNLVHAKLDLAESVFFVVLKIGERDLENTAFKGIVGILQTSGTVDKGFSHALQIVSKRIHSPRQKKENQIEGKEEGVESASVVELTAKERDRTYSRAWKVEGAYFMVSERRNSYNSGSHTFTEYSSFREKGSTVLFFTPFLPLDKRLFLKKC